MTPIYVPRGKAKEYGDYALNIYTGCPHRCYYCFAPNVLHKDREQFHSCVEPRKNIVAETRKQLEKDTTLRDKLIHLCFTCDPYPTGYDTTPTREIIKLLKEYENHVQILTKGVGIRDIPLLDDRDWYGITIDGSERLGELAEGKLSALATAHKSGINTWVSFEPIIDDKAVLFYLERFSHLFNKVKLGKLNYYKSDIDWKQFGLKAEETCKRLGIEYYIKESLREEMGK